jgi:hypothetical protein
MFPYVIEELSWAAMQEREREVRGVRGRTRSHTRPSHVRRFVARTLVHAGVHLDPKAGAVASRHADEGY